MGSIQEHDDPTVEEARALFQSLEAKFPSATVGSEKWYLIAVSSELK
jgi:hypothetical protein